MNLKITYYRINKYFSPYLLFAGMLLITGCSFQKSRQKSITALGTSHDNTYQLALAIGEYAHYYPGDVRHLLEYAEILHENKYDEECIRICSELIEKDKKLIQAYYLRALAFADDWNFEQSISDFQYISNLTVLNENFQEEYKKITIYNNIYNQILDLNGQIKENQQYFLFYHQRADLFLKMNEPVAAISDYRYFLDSAGYDADAAYNKLRAEFFSYKYEDAALTIKLIRDQGENSLLKPDEFALLLKDAKKNQGLISENPGNAEALMEMAKIYTYLKAEDLAAEYLKKALNIDPGNKIIKYRLALVYALSGQKEKASKLVKELNESGIEVPQELLNMLN